MSRWCEKCFNEEYPSCNEQCVVFGKDLEELAKVCFELQKQQKWIPCSERLPIKTNSYLVTKYISETEDRVEQYETCIEIFWTRDNKWDCERDEYCEWEVIAWQDNLKPYKEEK